MITVTALGVGEAFDEELANTSLLVEGPGTLLLDCGYAIPPQLWKWNADPELIDALYVSHAHADHYFGVPALLCRMMEENRQKPLTLISQPDVLRRVNDLLEYGYSGLRRKLPFALEQVEAAEGQECEVLGYRLRFAPGRHSVPNLAVRVEAESKSVCYSGDGMFTPAGRQLFSGADLVFHEAYSFTPSPVHADIDAVAELATTEQIGLMALVHLQRAVRRQERPRIEALCATARAPRVILPEPYARFRL